MKDQFQARNKVRIVFIEADDASDATVAAALDLLTSAATGRTPPPLHARALTASTPAPAVPALEAPPPAKPRREPPTPIPEPAPGVKGKGGRRGRGGPRYCTIEEKPEAGTVTMAAAAKLTGVKESYLGQALTPSGQAKNGRAGGYTFRPAPAPADAGAGDPHAARSRFGDDVLPINPHRNGGGGHARR